MTTREDIFATPVPPRIAESLDSLGHLMGRAIDQGKTPQEQALRLRMAERLIQMLSKYVYTPNDNLHGAVTEAFEAYARSVAAPHGKR